jgi:hypothetical protein
MVLYLLIDSFYTKLLAPFIGKSLKQLFVNKSNLPRQFEAILVLHGFYASDLYPKLGGATELTTATLKHALAQTKKNISDFKYGSPILEVDYRILCNIQQQLRWE